MRKKRSLILAIAGLLLAMGLNALVKAPLDTRVKTRKSETDIRYLPSDQMAKFLSFGYRELFADIIWVEALNYFGENLLKRENRSYKYLPQYVSLIAALDRYFEYFYEWASTIFIYNWEPITSESVARSTYFGNLGIIELSKIYRFSANLIKKNAYNLAIETKSYKPSADYLVFLSRVSPQDRDSLLIAATYFDMAGYSEEGRLAREEFFTYAFFEDTNRAKRQEAFSLLTSGGVNSGALEFLRNARLSAEKDEDLKKVMEARFKKDQSFFSKLQSSQPGVVDDRIQRIMSIPASKADIIPSSLLLLISI